MGIFSKAYEPQLVFNRHSIVLLKIKEFARLSATLSLGELFLPDPVGIVTKAGCLELKK